MNDFLSFEVEESSWMDGLTSFDNISVTFPWISTCRLMASDQEVGHLHFLPHLRHLEVDSPDILYLKRVPQRCLN